MCEDAQMTAASYCVTCWRDSGNFGQNKPAQNKRGKVCKKSSRILKDCLITSI